MVQTPRPRTRWCERENTAELSRAVAAEHRGYHILVVDDDPSVRRALEHVLGSNGFTVSTAATASAGIDIFEIQGADLVILDVRMPDIDGFRTCESLKSASDVPVIMITGARDEDVRENLPQMVDDAGADSYLRKPLDAEEIITLVRRFLHT